MFMRLLIEGDVGFQPLNLPREHSKQSNVHRFILSLAQDIMYACGKSIVTPKHMGLAVTMKHITGSKDVITILNRFGHCVSYEEVIRFDTMCANKQLHDSEHNGVIVPSNILSGSFIQAAADNLDFHEDTLDGKHTTHATTLVPYQRKVQGNFRTQYLPPTKDSKSRTLSRVPTCQTLLEFSRQKSKNKMAKVHIESEDFICSSENINVLTAKILDLAWLFARVCPMKQFEVSLQKDDKQTIPGWHAFNAIVSSPYMPDITTVGYCPLIPASPTEYSTVYTVVKTVQNLMKALNQAGPIVV